jgi:hypothetical protein
MNSYDSLEILEDCFSDGSNFSDGSDGDYLVYHMDGGDINYLYRNNPFESSLITNKKNDPDSFYYIEVEKVGLFNKIKNLTNKKKNIYLKIKKVLTKPCDDNKEKSNMDQILDVINKGCKINIKFSDIKEQFLWKLKENIISFLKMFNYKLKYLKITKKLKYIDIEGINYDDNGVLIIEDKKSSSTRKNSLMKNKKIFGKPKIHLIDE